MEKESSEFKVFKGTVELHFIIEFHDMSHFKKNLRETDYQPKMGHPGGSPSKTNGQSMEEMTALRVLFWSREGA